MEEINRVHAKRLFDLIVVEVDPQSIRLKPKQHKGNVLFCGYVDFLIGIAQVIGGKRQVIPWAVLCGSTIKLMGGEIHFDPKQERGRILNPKTGKYSYYPVWFPRTPEARVVFDAKITRLPEIQKMVKQAIAQTSQPF